MERIDTNRMTVEQWRQSLNAPLVYEGGSSSRIAADEMALFRKQRQ